MIKTYSYSHFSMQLERVNRGVPGSKYSHSPEKSAPKSKKAGTKMSLSSPSKATTPPSSPSPPSTPPKTQKKTTSTNKEQPAARQVIDLSEPSTKSVVIAEINTPRRRQASGQKGMKNVNYCTGVPVRTHCPQNHYVGDLLDYANIPKAVWDDAKKEGMSILEYVTYMRSVYRITVEMRRLNTLEGTGL